MSPKLSGRLFGSIRGCALRWFSSDIGCPLKSLLPRIRWGNIDIKKCQVVSRMQSKVETNLQPQSGGSLRGATNLISYFPPLWRDTNSDIKHCPLGLSNRSKDNSGKNITQEEKAKRCAPTEWLFRPSSSSLLDAFLFHCYGPELNSMRQS